MQLLSRLLLSSLAAAILSVLLAGITFAHPTMPNCSQGIVCMTYTGIPYYLGMTEHRWSQYGCKNLSDEYGQRYIINSQTDGATATLYTGFGCSGSTTTIRAGDTWNGDITPINSISLNKP